MTSRFKTVSIGNETYQLPLQGTSGPWGEQLSDLLEALIDVSNLTSGAADITETSAVILNTASQKEIVGLIFDPAVVRSAEISYNISRLMNKSISVIPTGVGTIVITCPYNHDLYTGDHVYIVDSNTVPSVDGYYLVKKVSDTQFSIIVEEEITVAGNSANFDIELVESGTLMINNSQEGWAMSQFGLNVGRAMVTLDINSSGQAMYTPTTLSCNSHTGLMKFIAKSLLDT